MGSWYVVREKNPEELLKKVHFINKYKGGSISENGY